PSAPPNANPPRRSDCPGTGMGCHATPSKTQVCTGNAPVGAPGPESPKASTGRPDPSVLSLTQRGALYGNRISDRATVPPSGSQAVPDQRTTWSSVALTPGDSTSST